MKKITKIVAMLAAVAILSLLPDTNAFTAQAAEPVYYAVKFDSTLGEWRMQMYTNQYDDTAASLSCYHLLQYVKDGDIVVVYNDVGTSVVLDLGSAHLGNLTLVRDTKSTIIKSGGADECHVQGGSFTSISGNMTSANVYDTATCTFTGNVETLRIYSSDVNRLASSVSVNGTVEHLYCTPLDADSTKVFYDLYRFSEGKLYVKDGTLQTVSSYYLDADQYTAQTAAEKPKSSPAPSSSNEYDDVPKTGQSYTYIWLLGAAVLFFAGSYALRRANR